MMPQVQEALARPIIHHRTPEFQDLFLQARSNLQEIFRTRNDLVILACSGTGGMEAAVANLLGPQSHALAVVVGKFGERWQDICKAYKIPCSLLCKEYGQAASVQEIRQEMQRHSRVDVLLIQGCETSTATSNDLQAIGGLIRQEFPQTLLVVDGITSVSCEAVDTDGWGLDVVVSASQKAFALPPGLSFVSISPRALERMQNASASCYYLNLALEARLQAEGKTAYTTSVSLVLALLEATRSILDQGLEKVIEETALMARAARAGLQALGFALLSSSPSNACTAAYPPGGIEAARLARRLQERLGLRVAGGQGKLKGKIIRIAHLGYFDLLDVFTVLSALELTLIEMGHSIEAGSGVRAAMQQATLQVV